MLGCLVHLPNASRVLAFTRLLVVHKESNFFECLIFYQTKASTEVNVNVLPAS